MPEETMPQGLIITDHYYCDNGSHAGLFFVKIEGYVTEEVLNDLHSGIGHE